MSDDPATLDPGALDRLLEMTGGDPAFLDELLETFIVDARAQVDALEAAVAAGAIDALVRPAHSLKSNSATVGATRLAELARTLEADARTGAMPAAVDRVGAVEVELAAVLASLRAARDQP